MIKSYIQLNECIKHVDEWLPNVENKTSSHSNC